MNFKNNELEIIFRSFKFARNNTTLLFEAAQKNLDYKQEYEKDDYTLLHQFQCILTTTDTYYRKIKKDKNKEYGILVRNGQIIKKSDISVSDIEKMLIEQLQEGQELFKHFDDKTFAENLLHIETLLNHEYLHQGQFVVMFREAGITFPERFQKTWAL